MNLVERLKGEIGNLVVQIHIMRGQIEELTAQLARAREEKAKLLGAEPELPLSMNGNGSVEDVRGEHS